MSDERALDTQSAECMTAARNSLALPDLFRVNDGGGRQEYASGMVREPITGKIQYDLVFDGPLIERLAIHLTKGAEKYEPHNWMKANSAEEMERFKQSASRHFIQWMRGDTDEDHFSAVTFNMNGYEFVKDKLSAVN